MVSGERLDRLQPETPLHWIRQILITGKEMQRFVLLLAWVAVGIVAGCSSGRPKTFQVSGTVTMKGQPVEGATVVFVPPDGASYQAAMGITDATGTFKLSTFNGNDGAQEGEYRIKVSKFNVKKPTKEEQERYISIEEERKMQFGDDKPAVPAKNLLPGKYNDEAMSGLTYTVKRGPNTVPLALE